MAHKTLHLFLTLALLVTSISAASARGAAPAVDQVVICSGHGVTVLFLDATGEPTQAPHLCPDCVLHLVAPLPGGVALVPQAVSLETTVRGRRTPQDVRPHLSPITSRGPPTDLI
mgnify:CR=1 FL=1